MPRLTTAGRNDLSTTAVLSEGHDSHSGGSGSDDDDEPPRLVIASHEFSPQQALYVRARHQDNPKAPIFYKDATPRAEHYMRCGVRVEGIHHGQSCPVRLEVCFPDGHTIHSKFETRPGKPETEALKVLGDTKKRFVVQPGTTSYFDYRIEVGSLRADDRKFCVKVVPDAEHVAGVLPAVTPGLLVLSKKRLVGADGRPEQPDPLRKRRRAGAPEAPGGPVGAIAYDPAPPAAYAPPGAMPPPAAVPPAYPPPGGMPLPPGVAMQIPPGYPPGWSPYASPIAYGLGGSPLAFMDHTPRPLDQAPSGGASAATLESGAAPPHVDLVGSTHEILRRVGALEEQVQRLVGHVQRLVAAGWAPPGATVSPPGAAPVTAVPSESPSPAPGFADAPDARETMQRLAGLAALATEQGGPAPAPPAVCGPAPAPPEVWAVPNAPAPPAPAPAAAGSPAAEVKTETS